MNDFHVFCFGFKLQAVLVQAHFVGFKFACMQKVEKKKKHCTPQGTSWKSNSNNLREPTAGISQIPSPDQSGQDNPACARRAA